MARQWRGDFGRLLTGVSMFRLVLLYATSRPEPTDILDDRICVAAPRMKGGRIAESKATYHVDSVKSGPNGRSSPGTNAKAADFRSLREVRRSNVSSSDPGLGRLASTLANYESQVNASVAADLHKMRKSGVVVTSLDRSLSRTEERAGREIQPGELFQLDNPESWVESAAAVLGGGIDSSITGDRVTPEDVSMTGYRTVVWPRHGNICGKSAESDLTNRRRSTGSTPVSSVWKAMGKFCLMG